ncbi:MAG: hypothetical protein HUJ28_11725 [Chromatiales bacterium]|nr:hypothetical protein [Chromatiales bacterium]
MRIKSRWNVKDKEHSIEEIAGALAFIAWRIAQNLVLRMENEDFQTDTQKQRLDVIFESMAFLIHIADRLAYESLDEEQRATYVTTMAMNTLRQMKTNLNDYGMSNEEVDAEYIPKLNERMADYAEFSFENEEPSFNMCRYLGEKVAGAMGPKDNKWIQSQIMDIEVPEAMKSLKKGFNDLFKTD